MTNNFKKKSKEWKRVRDFPPPNKMVLVWRKSNYRYIIAKPYRIEPDNEIHYRKKKWIIQTGVDTKASDDDYWIEFPYLLEEYRYNE